MEEKRAEPPCMALGRVEQAGVCGLVGLFLAHFLFFVFWDANFMRNPDRKGLEVVHLPAGETVPLRYFVDINTAGKEELMLLPGIGEILARKIVQYREANGPFQHWSELERVDGIRLKKIDALRGYLLSDTTVAGRYTESR